MTQFLHLQRKAREIDCSLTRGCLDGRKDFVTGKVNTSPYFVRLRNGRTVPASNLKEVSEILKRDYDDWHWENNLRDRTKYPRAKAAREKRR